MLENVNELGGKYERMTTDPVEKLVCRLAIPSIAIMLISALYNMADTFFVGSLGTSATAAVGVVFALMAIIQAIGYFFGHGAGNYISRELGAQNLENAQKMAATGFFSALIAGTLVAVLGLVFMEPLARFLGATETILPYTCDYMRFILIGAPFMAASLMLNNLLRFQSSAFYAMIGMVAGAVLNIALDPLFIFVFGMGVKGAALATMISQIVSFCLLLVGCCRKGNIKIHLSNFAPSTSAYNNMLKGGFPSLCRQSLASIAAISLNQVAGSYSDAAIAAISIVQRVTMFAGSALLGFGQGFQPVCGLNYGAKRYDRVKKAFWFCMRIATVALVFLAVLGFIFAPNIIALFRKDDMEVIKIGTIALRLQCVAFPVLGWIILMSMMMQTIGNVIPASILALARQGLFLLPFLFILTPFMGIFGVQVCQPAADLATFAISIPLGIRVLREMNSHKEADNFS